jgi:transcription elongation GreA/GreB family factor
MSRAFIREPDAPEGEALPELKISSHPNLVTRRGLAMIDEKIATLTKELASCPDELHRARIERDLRYWKVRHATATIAEVPDPNSDEVAFGSRVTVSRDGGPAETIEIVGEDEADPAEHRLSWVSPMAAALMGGMPGETVEVGPRRPPIAVRIIAVDNRKPH